MQELLKFRMQQKEDAYAGKRKRRTPNEAEMGILYVKTIRMALALLLSRALLFSCQPRECNRSTENPSTSHDIIIESDSHLLIENQSFDCVDPVKSGMMIEKKICGLEGILLRGTLLATCISHSHIVQVHIFGKGFGLPMAMPKQI